MSQSLRLVRAILAAGWTVLAFGGTQAPPIADSDFRAWYDVQTYRLDLKVEPEASRLSGVVGIEAKVVQGPLQSFELDLLSGRKVLAAVEIGGAISPGSSLSGKAVPFKHEGDRVRIRLSRAYSVGQSVRVAVSYELVANPSERRWGIRFGKTTDGKPWISTSCQVLGGHSWWPCKGENEHPSDKFARLFVNATVPKGLFAVSNGRLLRRSSPQAGWETFHWRHDYPCENYAVTLNVAPYVEVKSELRLPEIAKPVPFHYYVLPGDLDKAKLEFQAVPRMLEIYSEAFGPYPFPNSKFGLVQTDFWGMEHSTAVAYGNTWPSWLKKEGKEDPRAGPNKYFDYILIHEVAHEWWGNAVSAADWGHLWIHEGFATYTEGVYVEKLFGRAKADEYFATLRPRVSEQFREYRGRGALPSQAFNNNVYWKGAWILNTLRYYVDDDPKWWKSLREFNMRFRYRNATTEDFQKVLEEVTGKSWHRFFQEWFYGDGLPTLKGSVTPTERAIVVEVQNSATRDNRFHVPLYLRWTEGSRSVAKTLLLSPGSNRFSVDCAERPSDVEAVGLQRVLGVVDVRVGAPEALFAAL